MRFGLFYQIQVPKPWAPDSEAQRIWEVVEQASYAEEMGFHSLWLVEHHFRSEWSPCSAPDIILAAISQRTSKIRLGIAVVLVHIHHPLHVAVRIATLDILSRGRVDLGVGRAAYPYQLTPYGTELDQTRGMWEESLRMIPRIWTEEVFSHQGTYYNIPPREVVPKPYQKPHPPIWSACASEDTVRLTGEMGLGALFNSTGGPERLENLIRIYQDSIKNAQSVGKSVNNHMALSSIGFCHENRETALGRGTELVGWFMAQTRARAAMVWQGVDPATVPEDYKGYYEKDRRLASGPHADDPTPSRMVESGRDCIGTPDDCIRTVERYQAMGIEEIFPLIQIGPASHEEVKNTIRLFGKYIIPHFRD